MFKSQCLFCWDLALPHQFTGVQVFYGVVACTCLAILLASGLDSYSTSGEASRLARSVGTKYGCARLLALLN